ncbi:MAG TPA: hypothetical protein VFS05_15405 [Gemmatimonadaceae bacterium]|nr:hypothetical protein [Gemmatimonadaceae bacterium]
MRNPFRKSVQLRFAPTHRQARGILARLENDLQRCGASVERSGVDMLSFQMPKPWRTPHASWLLAASSGQALVTAAGGGPWRVRFDLRFTRLRYLCFTLSVVLIAVGFGWPRLRLLQALAWLWLVLYGGLGTAATATLARLVRRASAEVLERRETPRSGAVASDGAGNGASRDAAPGETTARNATPGSAAPESGGERRGQ